MIGQIVGAALLFVLLLWGFRWVRRLMFLKDYAYAVGERFGPTLRLPPPVRLRRAIPWLNDATVNQWLEEFAFVNKEVERIAEMGGVQKLGSSRRRPFCVTGSCLPQSLRRTASE